MNLLISPEPLRGMVGQGRVRHKMPSWVMTCIRGVRVPGSGWTTGG